MTITVKLMSDGWVCELCKWRRFASLPVAIMWAHGKGAERVIALFE